MSNLNDILVKPVPVMLDKERSFLFDWNALTIITEQLGDINEALKRLDKDNNPKDLQVFIWAGLSHEDDNLTLKQVGRMMFPKNIKYISEKLGEALKACMPEAEKN